MFKFFLPIFIIFSFAKSQLELFDFTFQGYDREYILYVPDSLDTGASLVFVFHGYGGSASNIMLYSDFNEVAEENGFVVCYPQGLIDNFGSRFWNVGYDFHQNQANDDVAFVDSLAKFLTIQYHLNSYNIYSTGMSNGGDISYLFACNSSRRFQAIAPVAGALMTWIYEECDPERLIPVFAIHGTADDVTYWDGAGSAWWNFWGPWESVDTTLTFFSEINECSQSIRDTLNDIDTDDGSYVVSHKEINGINGNEIWLYEVVDGGHDWPGAWGNMDINATREIWNFFSQFSVFAELGDMNFDRSINVLDVLLIIDSIINNNEYIFIADPDQNGQVNFADATIITRIVMGILSIENES